MVPLPRVAGVTSVLFCPFQCQAKNSNPNAAPRPRTRRMARHRSAARTSVGGSASAAAPPLTLTPQQEYDELCPFVSLLRWYFILHTIDGSVPGMIWMVAHGGQQ